MRVAISRCKTRRFYNDGFGRPDDRAKEFHRRRCGGGVQRREAGARLGPHARFFTTASQLDQLPQTELPEIAFVGRSNAGKSTAITC